MRNSNINKGTLFLLNGFTFLDQRLNEIISLFLKQLNNARDSEADFLAFDLRISYMSNKKVKENRVPLDLNFSPLEYRRASLRGIKHSLTLIE